MITNQVFTSFQIEQAKKGRDASVDNLKLITYNIYSTIFDFLDFENDNAFQEPLLYAFFNSPKRQNIELLKCILLGYMDADKQDNIEIDFTDVFESGSLNSFLLPRIGLLNTAEYSPQEKLSGTQFLRQAAQYIEPLYTLKDKDISIIPLQLDLLAPFYYDSNHVQLDVDIASSFEKNHPYFEEAFTDMCRHLEWFDALVSSTVKYAILFNDSTNPYSNTPCKRNSFASFGANGISFHNCYQPWYDKVFFYDDIAHQMGHVIFYSILQEKESYFLIDPKLYFRNNYSRGVGSNDERNHETVFHALYTYYTTLSALDKMYEKALLNNRQKTELLGRIGFYLNKNYLDLSYYDIIGKNGNIKQIFTEKGVYVFKQFVSAFKQYHQKYFPVTKNYIYTNQTYNFNWLRFEEINQSMLSTE
jgi:hypothetical protein